MATTDNAVRDLLENNDLAPTAMIGTSKASTSAAEELMTHVIKANFDEMAKYWDENIELMFQAVSIADSDGNMKEMSPLQKAFELNDSYTWLLFLNKIASQIELLVRFYDQEAQLKQHIDLEPLFAAYEKGDELHKLWAKKQIADEELHDAWIDLGKKQRQLLPMHMLREFCRPSNYYCDWSPQSNFKLDWRYSPAPKGGAIFRSPHGSAEIALDSNAIDLEITLVRGRLDHYRLPAATCSGHYLNKDASDFDKRTFRRLWDIRRSDLATLSARWEEHAMRACRLELIRTRDNPAAQDNFIIHLDNIMKRIPTDRVLPAIKLFDEDTGFKYTILHYAARFYPEALDVILGYVPKDQVQEAVMIESGSGWGSVLSEAAEKHESFKTVMAKIPEHQRIEAIERANKFNMTILLPTKSSESLRILIDTYPKDHRLVVIRSMNGQSQQTILHQAAIFSTEFVKVILPYIPPEDMLATITTLDGKGNSVMHYAARDKPKVVLLILARTPKDQWLEAISVKDKNNFVVLHSAVCSLEVLQILLAIYEEFNRPDALLSAISAVDDCGNTIIHHAIKYPNCLECLLEHIPKDGEHLIEAVTAVNKNGQTPLAYAREYERSMMLMVKHIPVNRLLSLLTEPVSIKTTLLHYVARHYPVVLLEILERLPSSQRLDAINVAEQDGTTVLSAAKVNPKSYQVLLNLDLIDPEQTTDYSSRLVFFPVSGASTSVSRATPTSDSEATLWGQDASNPLN